MKVVITCDKSEFYSLILNGERRGERMPCVVTSGLS